MSTESFLFKKNTILSFIMWVCACDYRYLHSPEEDVRAQEREYKRLWATQMGAGKQLWPSGREYIVSVPKPSLQPPVLFLLQIHPANNHIWNYPLQSFSLAEVEIRVI